MTKQASTLKAADFDVPAHASDDEETAPLPILETRGRFLDEAGILLGLGNQLEQLLALGRSINANLEKLAKQSEADNRERPRKRSKRSTAGK